MTTFILCPPSKAPKLPTVGVHVKTLGEHKRAFLNANNRRGWPIEEDVGLTTVLEESKPTEKYAEVIKFLLDKLYDEGFALPEDVMKYRDMLLAVTNNELEEVFIHSMIATRFGFERWDDCIVYMNKRKILIAKSHQLKYLLENPKFFRKGG